MNPFFIKNCFFFLSSPHSTSDTIMTPISQVCMGPTPSIFQHCPGEALTRQSCGNTALRGHPQAPRVALCPLACHQFLSTTCRLRTFHGSFTVTVPSNILHQLCPCHPHLASCPTPLREVPKAPVSLNHVIPPFSASRPLCAFL